jgi:hypothetical protein
MKLQEEDLKTLHIKNMIIVMILRIGLRNICQRSCTLKSLTRSIKMITLSSGNMMRLSMVKLNSANGQKPDSSQLINFKIALLTSTPTANGTLVREVRFNFIKIWLRQSITLMMSISSSLELDMNSQESFLRLHALLKVSNTRHLIWHTCLIANQARICKN